MRRIPLLFYIIAITIGCQNKNTINTGFEGKPMPSFTLLLTDSVTHLNTSSIPSGRFTVFLYIDPHCPYCRAEMQAIIEDMPSMKTLQFYIFTSSPFAEIKKFYTHYKLNEHPNISVGFDYNNFFGPYVKANGVPYTAIYNKDKKLTRAFIGNISAELIKEVASE